MLKTVFQLRAAIDRDAVLAGAVARDGSRDEFHKFDVDLRRLTVRPAVPLGGF